YRHIFYSGVASIANSSTTLGYPTNPLGSSVGPGFGWKDVDVIALAAAYKATKDLTLRVGYSHNTNPIGSEDVMFNVFAPGIVTDHVSTGFSWQITKNSGIDFAFAYVPRASLSGKTLPQLAGWGYTQQDVKVSMQQYEVSLGYSYKF
ncbi:MAG: hypothetical protein GX458_10220, partial [Phyllobacteriaceae bacterium]|nr:hypothetical protein [Phyllobacteriaceae bacterium]